MMRSSSSLSSSGGRSTPSLGRRQSTADIARPPSSRGFRPQSPRLMPPRSRPGSAMGSRPSTPLQKTEAYTGTIKVSIRPNPKSPGGLQNRRSNWEIDEHGGSITHTPDGTCYCFDNVFPATHTVSNREVYNRSCAHLVDSFLNEGFNCTLFAYGMTGSGKTYSMRGEDNDPGFVKLAIDDIFCKIEKDSVTKTHTLTASYIEIYNERIVDLLGSMVSSSPELKIRDDAEFGTRIVGTNSPQVLSKQQLLQLIKTGDTRRKTSATDYNARSSRSHAILQLRLHTIDTIANSESRSTLSLCDLAGSERATSSAERRKEGAFINKSLLALSTVMNKLSLLSTSGYVPGTEHIPYRDSKLTRLLQPALSGSSLISILCTVHLGASQPALDQQVVTETNNTLRFAARAKDIIMDVSKNKKTLLSGQDSAKIIEELRQTISMQKQQIDTLKLSKTSSDSSMGTNTHTAVHSAVAELQAEIKIQNERIEHLNRLNDLQRTETILLRNDVLNDILGVDFDKRSPKMMMSNLEEFYKRVNYELEEHKAYIFHLEKQLEHANQKIACQSNPTADASPTTDIHLQELLREQEEEIWQLRETLKDKDQIINSLTKTSKLRRLVDSNSGSNSNSSTDFSKLPSISRQGGLSNKENNPPVVEEFNLSPTKATVNRVLKDSHVQRSII